MLIGQAAAAQLVEDSDSWQQDVEIDRYLNVLRGPVWQPVWFTPADRPGYPALQPLYKQQPPGAQQDFRVNAGNPGQLPVTMPTASPLPTANNVNSQPVSGQTTPPPNPVQNTQPPPAPIESPAPPPSNCNPLFLSAPCF